MCGIAGIFSGKPTTGNTENLFKLLLAVEERGKDATGMGWIDDKGDGWTVKAAIPASEAVAKWRKLKEEPMASALVHARKKTIGDPANMDNNHPIEHEGRILVHNGSISNHFWLDSRLDTKIPGEVDSRQILAAILDQADKNKGVVSIDAITKGVDKLTGTFAVAMIDASLPNKMWLWRRTSPLELVFDKEKNIMYFASTESALGEVANIKEETLNGFTRKSSDMYWLSLPNDTGLEITRSSNGVLSWKSFSIAPTPPSFALPVHTETSNTKAVCSSITCKGIGVKGDWIFMPMTVWGSTTGKAIVERYKVEEMNEEQIRYFIGEIAEYLENASSESIKFNMREAIELASRIYLPSDSGVGAGQIKQNVVC